MADQIVKTDQSTNPSNPLTRALANITDKAPMYPNCPICKSPHREEIEKCSDSGMVLNAIKNTIETSHKVCFTTRQLRHHIDNHYKNIVTQCAIAEYRDHLGEMMKRRRNMVDDITAQIEISWKELSEILVIPTGEDLEKVEKKQKVIAGLQKTIKENYEFLNSMHDSDSKAKAAEERFVKVWAMKLEDAKSDDEKKVIIATLKDFQQTFKKLVGD